MELPEFDAQGQEAIQTVLGYLNFSSGATDPQFLAKLNFLFGLIEKRGLSDAGEGANRDSQDSGSRPPTWRIVGRVLQDQLDQLKETSPAFRDAAQATAVLKLVRDQVLPGYLQHHQDLLFHQTEAMLLRPLLVGRVIEAVLQQGPPWDQAEQITPAVLLRLNDYLGHRPVATLQTHKHEPYPHEWVRPIPLFIRGAGVAVGRYHDVIGRTLELLEETPEDLLRQACFDPAMLEELALDPRAYDFDHPANKRPNYHFGQWDPHRIDQDGRYRRFVIQQVTLDALSQRKDQAGKMDQEELFLEAAAVLAGTILMASGISGSGPDTHDSMTTLSTLLPRIAAYRDEFYEHLLERITGAHGKRLQQEGAQLKQPLGGARQHLNAQLSRHRAAQLEHIQLAKIFARLGYPEAAVRQVHVLPVASARVLCQIDCHLSAAHHALDSGRPARAAEVLVEIMDLLQRGIQCGAVIDPWNILGFHANFSLFAALENSVVDHRAEQLIALLDRIFALYARAWSEAAAQDDGPLGERIARQFHETASWWYQYAVHEVSAVEAADAMDTYRAAEHVAQALNLWHKGGAGAGDVRYWAPHAEMFDSPKAYALVIDALLNHGDFVASMGLLVHWLSQADRVGLHKSESSFHELALRWLCQLMQSGPDEPAERWALVKKLFDYLEANADTYWQVPQFQLHGSGARREEPGELDSDAAGDEQDPENLYSAAYENVVFRDSAEDGFEGSVFDSGQPSQDELEQESKRIGLRLNFLVCLASLWKLAACSAGENLVQSEQHRQLLLQWFSHADAFRRQLAELIQQIGRYRIAGHLGQHEDMIAYDRRRMVKEVLLEQSIAACVEMSDAAQYVLATACAAGQDGAATAVEQLPEDLDDQMRHAIVLFSSVFSGNVDRVQAQLEGLLQIFSGQPILYIPISKGGDPGKIVAARVRQRTIQNLLAWLPRLGLLCATRQLLDAARLMERDHPAGPGAVTEFEDLFEVGYQALVDAVISASENSEPSAGQQQEGAAMPDADLVSSLEQMTQGMIECWLAHSHTLRLSVLEHLSDAKRFKQFSQFIRRYGGDLFTQQFMNLANLRSIRHQGVERWLEELENETYSGERFRFMDDLGGRLSRASAVSHLTLIMDAIMENYSEYRDYNTTTTQSDRGEMLYTLLDFLRLRVAYDRIAWNLKPVVLVHQMLVRRGHTQAARLWRQALAERFDDEARRFLKRLARLQKKYAMRMPTVADRLAQRFVLPMTVDRLCALVEPAMQEAKQPGPSTSFDLLEKEAILLAQEPTGVGLEIPFWLAALDLEVQRASRPSHEPDPQKGIEKRIPQIRITLDDVQAQLDQWTEGEGK